MPDSPWIVARPMPSARLRLFCFPFAGGSAASFTSWQNDLQPSIQVCAVQPPGRGARFGQTPLTDWGRVVDQLGEVLLDYCDLPYAFFGHSLGGMVAFELARTCAARQLPLPCHLFISATNAPQTVPNRPDITTLDDNALLARLREYNGSPAEVLDNRELMELLLPVVRADLTLLQNYRYRPHPPLPVPISVLAGSKDAHLDHQTLADWHTETGGVFREHAFAGDHFYLQPERAGVLNLLRMELARYI